MHRPRALVAVGLVAALIAAVVLRTLADTPPAGSASMQAAADPPPLWVSIGPRPLAYATAPTNPRNFNSGRVSAIAVDPSDPSHWLLGVGNGGVWRSRDAGSTWTPITDTEATLATGAVAFAPSNPQVIYVGTGEPGGGIGFAKSGIGLLKSVNGGGSWAVLGASSFARASIRRVRVHPADANTLLAISGRGGYGRESREGTPSPPPFGVWRSIDGAVSWTRTLAGQATALEIDPGNFSRQYAALGDQRTGVLNDTPGAAQNGIYRSTDGGQSWSFVAGPWGTATLPLAATGRIELAMAPSNPNVVYAGIQIPPNGGVSGNGLLGLYRTDDAWAPTPTWVQVPTAATGPGGYCGPGKCGYTHAIIVDPDDPNVLVAGGAEQGFWRCTNCGAAAQWNNIVTTAPIHSDLHTMAWVGRRLIVGNDGGVWSTTDFGATWQNHNATLPTGMFFGAALHPTNPGGVLGGLRDFQLSLLRAGVGWVILQAPLPGLEWGEAEVAISDSRPDSDWMAGWVFGRIMRTTNGGASGVVADAGIDLAGAAFVAPVRKCPANDNVFLTGTNRIYRSNNFFNAAAPTWSPNGPAHPHPFPGSLDAPGTILSIAFVAADTGCNTYAWGNRGGQIQMTRDGGATWSDLDPAHTLPARSVNSLVFDPANPDVLYAALSGFDFATPGKPGHVFRTTNVRAASPVWTTVSPPVDTPFNVLAIDPRNTSLIYAGSDTGLWLSTDAGATWSRQGLASGLPPASVYDLKINPVTDRTAVFTYGRGAYLLASPPGTPRTLSASVVGNTVTLQWAPPETVQAASYILRAGTASGVTNLADFDTGTPAPGFAATVPNGVYFVRVHSRNGAGVSAASNEVSFTVGPVPCTQPPGPPGTLTSSVNGLVASFSWTAAAGASGYALEAGSAPSLANLAVLALGATTSFSTPAPPGTYFVRLRGTNACGTGAPSNELQVVVGAAVPLPGPPTGASSSVAGQTVTIGWAAPVGGGPVADYVVEAGSAPGLANLALLPIAGPPLVVPGVPPGTYFVRVRARNVAGLGPPTPDLTIVVP